MIDLSNTNIILTGATGVIGGAILNILDKSKANIIATGTNTDKLNLIEAKYKNVTSKKFDISDHKSIETFVTECNKFFEDKINILINNAGITLDNLSIRMKDDEWNRVININLTSSFLLSKNVIKKMLKNKNGKIINITSVVGHTGNIGQANYAASKSGLIGMSKSLALEYGKKNIKVNCISPGFIKSVMTDKISDDYKQTMLEKISLERFGSPQKLLPERVFLGMIRGQADHVGGLKPPILLEPCHFVGIGLKNFLLSGIGRQIAGCPTIEMHTVGTQFIPDGVRVCYDRLGLLGLVLMKNAQGGHRRTLMVSSSHSKRNSNASIWRRQSAMVRPQV